MRKLLYILVITFLTSQLSATKCTIKTDGLTADKESYISITATGETVPNRVDIIYSPNSQTSHKQTLSFEPSLSLIPQRPGISKIAVFDAYNIEMCSQLVSVHFNGIPWSGVIIFLLAGITLFTGTFISLKKALAQD